MGVKSLVLCGLATVAHGGMILESWNAPVASADTRPFRGVKKGDIWGPPIRGTNKIGCGSEAVGPVSNFTPGVGPAFRGEPIPVKAGAMFDLYVGLTLPVESKTGTLELMLKYGTNVRFFRVPPGEDEKCVWCSDGWRIYANGGDEEEDTVRNFDHAAFGAATPACQGSSPDDAECIRHEKLTYQIPEKGEGGYTGQAVIQVTYTAKDKKDKKGEPVVYIQCIDLSVTDGDELPDQDDYPWGSGNPKYDTGNGVVVRSITNNKKSGGLSTLAIVLIVLGVLLLFCLIALFLKYKSSQKDQSEKFPPQMAMDEKVVVVPEPVSEKRATPPPPPAEEPASDPEPPKELEAPPAPEEEPPEKAVAAGDGSSGRYFHFTYVDDEEAAKR